MSPDSPNVTAAAEPHPEIVELLERASAAPAPPFESLSPESAREIMAERVPAPDDPTPVGDVMDLSVGDEGIPVRVYVPDAEGPHPALVYFHGGGWVLGDLDTHDETCRALTDEANCLVVSVDYRRAPEHPFPAPLEDCYTAAKWVVDNAEPMRVDPSDVTIGGDSAGGNLAAAVALLSRNRGGPSFARQLLIYPAVDPSLDTPSAEENAEGYVLTTATMEWFWDHYLRDEVDRENPYAAPLRSRSLEGLPPATVVTCGFDPLRDEGAAFAARLRNAGVAVDHRHYADAIHGVARMLVDPVDLTRGRELLADVAADLGRPETAPDRSA